MAQITIGRILPIFKGNWDTTTTYTKLDIVYYQGSSYVAKIQNTGQAPTDTTYWQIVAKASTWTDFSAEEQAALVDYCIDVLEQSLDLIPTKNSTNFVNSSGVYTQKKNALENTNILCWIGQGWGFNTSTGIINSGAGVNRNVTELKKIEYVASIKNTASSPQYYVAYYDSNKTFISADGWKTARTYNLQTSKPSTAVYFSYMLNLQRCTPEDVTVITPTDALATELDGDVTTLETNLTSLSGTVGTINTNLQSLTTEVGTINSEVGDISDTVDLLDTQLQNVDGRVTAIEQNPVVIDANPTNNSNNAVSSNGVFQAINFESGGIEDIYIYPEFATQTLYGQPNAATDGYVGASGTWTQSSTFASCRVEMTPTHTYKIVYQNYSNGTYFRVFTVERVNGSWVWTQVLAQRQYEGEYEYTCPDDGNTYVGQLVRVMSQTGRPYIYDLSGIVYTPVKTVIQTLESEVGDIDDTVDLLDTQLQSVDARVTALEQQPITIDATPTANSNNAVSSNGVYQELNYETQSVEDKYIYPEVATETLYGYPNAATNGFVNASGDWSQSNTFASCRVEMTPTHTYKFDVQSTSSGIYVRIYTVVQSGNSYVWTQVYAERFFNGGTYNYICPDDGNIYVGQTVRNTTVSGRSYIYDLSGSEYTPIKEKVQEIDERLEDVEEQIDTKHLNICVLGNSYTCDSFMYVPFILQNYGITSNVHLYYRGSGTIDNLISEWNASSAGSTRYHYSVDTRTETAWKTATTLTAKGLVELESDWDMIVTTQQSVASLTPSTFDNLDTLIQLINVSMPNPYILGYQIAYTRYSYDQPLASLTTQTAAIKPHAFAEVFPVGTAVFNARQNSTLNQLGSSTHKNMWVDDVHLQDGIPCYIAALAIVEKIFRVYGYGKSVMQDTLRPTEDWCTAHAIKDRQGGTSCGLTSNDDVDLNVYLAQKAAIVAVNNPAEIIAI